MLIYTSQMDFALAGPEVPRVVAYLRARPSAGAASDEAMSMQRAVLADMTANGEIVVVAEFIEQEDGHDDRPTYRAAYREAAARGCALLTAGWGAIGSGPWLKLPDAGRGTVPMIQVSVPYVRFADLIPVPEGGPAPVALWADYRRPQGVTAIYLCNAGPDAMECIALGSAMAEIGVGNVDEGSRSVEPIPAGMARLLTVLFHDDWTAYSTYRLSYTSGGTPWGPLVASDQTLNSEWLTEDPSKVWAGFRPASRPSAPDASAG